MTIQTKVFYILFAISILFSSIAYTFQEILFVQSEKKELDKTTQVVQHLKDDLDTFSYLLLDTYGKVHHLQITRFRDGSQLDQGIVGYNLAENPFSYISDIDRAEYGQTCKTDRLYKKVSSDHNIAQYAFCDTRTVDENNKPVSPTIYVITSEYTSYDSALSLLRQTYIIIISITIILSVVISYFTALIFSKPIKQINIVAKKISRFDFSDKLDVQTNDEIEELSDSINFLSVTLDKAITQLKETLDLEKQRSERQKQLFASISHELKTPIAILKGTLEGIKDKVGRYKNPDDHIDGLIEEVEAMEMIVMNLLKYSKNTSSNFQLSMRSENILDLVELELEHLKFLYEEKKIKIETEIFDQEVKIDYQAMQMVLKNILENAIYYSPPHSTVHVLFKDMGQAIKIQVINEGVQLDESKVDKLFDPFYRDENTRSKFKHGTGLGLSLVKNLLEGHNSKFKIFNTKINDKQAVCFEFILFKAKDNE